ncbi:MAG: DUF3307 domain-containing protein [Elusimicrobia bacterium]|nr:DUF3307 domain-containing protein [Candidatus Obscuribacterium magneticum]
MEIFFRLLFGHLLADFTFQTNFIADWKRRSYLGLFVHVFTHPACYIPLLWPFLGDVWVSPFGIPLTGWVCLVIITILHFVEDWFRVTMVNRGWPDNTAFYTWDQFIHIFIIWLVSPLKAQPMMTQWPYLGIFFVVVTHFATVTVYFIEKDIYGGEYPETNEKYISIMQRLVVWMAFFLPSPWWFLVLLFVLVSFGRHVWTRRLEFTWSSVVLGNFIAIACGLITRFGLKNHF